MNLEKKKKKELLLVLINPYQTRVVGANPAYHKEALKLELSKAWKP